MKNKIRISDIDEVMYSCGLEILHPGGIEKTDEMARRCRIGKDKKVLDIGCGKGFTANYLSKKYGCYVIGVDLSEKMIKYSSKKFMNNRKVRFVRADACSLPFKDRDFDVILVECVTTLLNKKKAYSELLRVLKSGGYIGDLEMMWRKRPPIKLTLKLKELWGGFETMTLSEWKGFFKSLKLKDIQIVDFSYKVKDMERETLNGLGYLGIFKLLLRLIINLGLLNSFREYKKVFDEYSDYIGYGYVIGRK